MIINEWIYASNLVIVIKSHKDDSCASLHTAQMIANCARAFFNHTQICIHTFMNATVGEVCRLMYIFWQAHCFYYNFSKYNFHTSSQRPKQRAFCEWWIIARSSSILGEIVLQFESHLYIYKYTPENMYVAITALDYVLGLSALR